MPVLLASRCRFHPAVHRQPGEGCPGLIPSVRERRGINRFICGNATFLLLLGKVKPASLGHHLTMGALGASIAAVRSAKCQLCPKSMVYLEKIRSAFSSTLDHSKRSPLDAAVFYVRDRCALESWSSQKPFTLTIFRTRTTKNMWTRLIALASLPTCGASLSTCLTLTQTTR